MCGISIYWRIIGFRDLGYAPINRGSLSASPLSVFNVEDDIEADCGPVGPPDPDYVPGSVVIDQELVENEGEVDALRNIEDSEYGHYTGNETSDEEDDIDDPTSGIFARLKSAARKFGSPCGAV